MKKLLLASLLGMALLVALPRASAQTVALPTATGTGAQVPWTAGSCPTGYTCSTQLFRCQGTAATCLAASTVWTLDATLAGASGTQADTGLTAGATYCYSDVAVFAAPGATTPSNAPPSAIECVTVPLSGGAATLGTLSATS